jgi:hypothetical protein
MDWAAFWANFSRTHRVTLLPTFTHCCDFISGDFIFEVVFSTSVDVILFPVSKLPTLFTFFHPGTKIHTQIQKVIPRNKISYLGM